MKNLIAGGVVGLFCVVIQAPWNWRTVVFGVVMMTVLERVYTYRRT